MAPEPDDPLDELRDRLRETQEAAERIAGEVPPQGWKTPEENRAAADEVEALIGLVRALRDLVPPELVDQVRDVLRQLLLLLRAIIDWWVERLELGEGDQPPVRMAEVQDIPIR